MTIFGYLERKPQVKNHLRWKMKTGQAQDRVTKVHILIRLLVCLIKIPISRAYQRGASSHFWREKVQT